MGYLIYDSNTRIAFDDHVLAHLELVIVSKLRRRESFPMTWWENADAGGGRNTVWFDVSLPLRFRIDTSDPITIDREWLERLATSASGNGGLVVVDAAGQPATGTVTSNKT